MTKQTQAIHFGMNRKTNYCRQNGNLLEHVSDFKYLDRVFSEDGKLDRGRLNIEV